SRVALRKAVCADPTAFDMRRRDRQHVAVELSCREPRKCVRCICRWVRTSIHIYSAVDLSDLPPVMNCNKPLRERIALFPYAVIARRHPGVGRNVAHALLLFYRLSRGGPGQSVKTSGIVQRNSAPIRYITGCGKQPCILMIEPPIRPGKIHTADQ